MDVRPVGLGLGGADPAGRSAPVARAGSAEVARAGMPRDVAALGQLSERDIARLIALLDPALPEKGALVEELLRTALAAAAEGDAMRTLDRLTEVIAAEPARAPALRAEAGLENMRASVDQLVTRLETAAKLYAEGRLAEAARVQEAAGGKKLADWDAQPEKLLTLAQQLMDAGGHSNYVRAATVAQAMIDGAHWGPAAGEVPVVRAVEERARAEGGEAAARTARGLPVLWRRAPLLILLLAWLALGLAGGGVFALLRHFRRDDWPRAWADVRFDVWGVGFLALVGFGFYMRVRKVRWR
jgi:hypothetical protein